VGVWVLVCTVGVCVCDMTHVCDTTHVCDISIITWLIFVTWLFKTWFVTWLASWHITRGICVKSIFSGVVLVDGSLHTCDMIQSHVRHDSFMCVTWLNQMCDMTQSYVRHDSVNCVTRLSQLCDMTNGMTNVGRWSSTNIWPSGVVYTLVTWHSHICDMTLSYLQRDTHEWHASINQIFDISQWCG